MLLGVWVKGDITPPPLVGWECAEFCSAADASAAVGDSAERAAEENYGQEAKGLVGSAREATGNVGKVAVDAVLGTSVVWQAGEAAVGVAKAGDIEKKDEKVAEMEDVKI